MCRVIQGAVLVAGADNIMASAEDCCSACWALGGRPGPARYGPNATINGTAGAAGGGSDGASAAARGSGYVSSGPGAPAGAPTGPTCNAWSYCSSPIGCRLGSNPTLYPQARALSPHPLPIACQIAKNFRQQRDTQFEPSILWTTTVISQPLSVQTFSIKGSSPLAPCARYE